MSVRVRFAPSPSGYLHVGGARTALFNDLFARGRGGVFVLRIEDTDAARSTDESVRAILDSLRWLGLHWDEGPLVGGPHGPYFQSQRRERYRRHGETLRAAGHAYDCYCTPDELDARRASLAERGGDTRYDRRCRTLGDAARAAFQAEGRTPALRFAVEANGEVGWEDAVRDRVAFDAGLLEDFVLLRSDGLPTYNFACVADDHDMQITHVIRGDDHISNTPRQLLLYRALGWVPPVFAHVPMILGEDGQRLSKRHGATSVEAFREMGYLPSAMTNFLALLGWSFDGERELFSLTELEAAFSLERCGSNPSVFNLEKLEWMNAQHLKRLSEPDRIREVRDFLAGRGHDLSARSPEWIAMLVRALGDRLKTLRDAERYGSFALEPSLAIDPEAWSGVLVRPQVADRLEALAQALSAVDSFSLEGLEQATRAMAVSIGIKAGELIGLARVALTGRTTSPGIFEVMGLLGRDQTLARLRSAAERWRRESAPAGV